MYHSMLSRYRIVLLSASFLYVIPISAKEAPAPHPTPKETTPKDPVKPVNRSTGSSAPIIVAPPIKILPDPKPMHFENHRHDQNLARHNEPRIQLPTPTIPVKPKKRPPLKLARPRLFFASFEENFLTIYNVSGRRDVGRVGEDDVPPSTTTRSLVTATQLRESKNDVMRAKAEYLDDQVTLTHLNQLHEQNIALFAKHAISRQDFEESEQQVQRLQGKVLESQARVTEYETMISLRELNTIEVNGGTVSARELAQVYVNLWKSRWDKVLGALQQTKALFDYQQKVLTRNLALFESHAISNEELIQTQRFTDDAKILLKLATDLVQQNEGFYNDALHDLSQAEAEAQREASQTEGASKS